MSQRNPGQIRVTLPEEDVHVLMAIVRQVGSSRTRILRLALAVYKDLSDHARGENDTLVVLRDGDPLKQVALPWQDTWTGLPEAVDDDSLSHHGDVDAYRASATGQTSTRSPAWTVHPGELLAEEIEARGWSPLETQGYLNWEPELLAQVLAGQRDINEAMAKNLHIALGTSAQFWTNLQRAYDDRLTKD